MTQQRPGNTANLKAAAERRHQAAETRAELPRHVGSGSGEPGSLVGTSSQP